MMRGPLLLARVPALLALALLLLEPTTVHAGPQPGDETARVAASERYRAGKLYRLAMGNGYRDLWQAKITLPVLDLKKVGGGLTPRGRFGGLQSAVLALKGADGRSYTFRGTDKDPSAVLDPMLRETVIRYLVQDQMMAQHPAGPLVAGTLSSAAGVLTIRERLVVMPDDASLGKYREEFAGMVGSFSIYPTPAGPGQPGYHGATEIIGHKELYSRLRAGTGGQVDSVAFLRARLLDMLIGDFDRHRKQWRWARIPGNPRWQPIPEDRDQAFVRYDGAGQRLAYLYVPIMQCYGPDYPWIKGLTLHGWEQDRWLLAGLSWRRWQEAIKDLRSRLSDRVIDDAVARMPPEYQALDGQRLRDDIRSRRDKLEGAGRAFYEHLAGQVDVQGADTDERVQARWSRAGDLTIQVRPAGAAASTPPLFSRRFLNGETDEVRVYLRGGRDTVTVRGTPGDTVLRIISGGGRKLVDDSRAGGTMVYDTARTTKVRRGPRTAVIREPYTLPKPNSGFLEVEDIPPREWGYDVVPFPQLGYESDVGLLIGLGAYFIEYGFRKHPWSRRHKVAAAFATGALLPIVEYSGEFRSENSSLMGLLDLRYTGIEIVRYHGLGNESDNSADDAHYRVRNQQLMVEPGLSWTFLDSRLKLYSGLRVGYSRTTDGDRLIDTESPYGAGGFVHSGVFARAILDLRRSEWDDVTLALPIHDNPAAGYATSGVLVDVRADVSPDIWDVEEPWGSISGSVAGYLGLGSKGRLALALRLGGKWTWGKVPYFGAAYLGGGGVFSGGATARGFRPQRFAGDAAVYGNFDARLFLARITLVVPCDIGINGFVDAGRVFLEDESSSDWHPSGGGGIWIAPLARTNTLTLSVAGSGEDVLAYVRAGFHY